MKGDASRPARDRSRLTSGTPWTWGSGLVLVSALLVFVAIIEQDPLLRMFALLFLLLGIPGGVLGLSLMTSSKIEPGNVRSIERRARKIRPLHVLYVFNGVLTAATAWTLYLALSGNSLLHLRYSYALGAGFLSSWGTAAWSGTVESGRSRGRGAYLWLFLPVCYVSSVVLATISLIWI